MGGVLLIIMLESHRRASDSVGSKLEDTADLLSCWPWVTVRVSLAEDMHKGACGLGADPRCAGKNYWAVGSSWEERVPGLVSLACAAGC